MEETTREFEATLDVSVRAVGRPVITDREHVLRWLCDDGQWFEGARNGFTFAACPDHPDPEECVDCDTLARGGADVYSVLVMAAGLEES